MHFPKISKIGVPVIGFTLYILRCFCCITDTLVQPVLYTFCINIINSWVKISADDILKYFPYIS